MGNHHSGMAGVHLHVDRPRGTQVHGPQEQRERGREAAPQDHRDARLSREQWETSDNFPRQCSQRPHPPGQQSAVVNMQVQNTSEAGRGTDINTTSSTRRLHGKPRRQHPRACISRYSPGRPGRGHDYHHECPKKVGNTNEESHGKPWETHRRPLVWGNKVTSMPHTRASLPGVDQCASWCTHHLGKASTKGRHKGNEMYIHVNTTRRPRQVPTRSDMHKPHCQHEARFNREPPPQVPTMQAPASPGWINVHRGAQTTSGKQATEANKGIPNP